MHSLQGNGAMTRTVSPSPEPSLDEDEMMMVMLNELHSNMPEIDRPMSLSDLSDAQTERARKAVRAVIVAAYLSKPAGHHTSMAALEAVLKGCDNVRDYPTESDQPKMTVSPSPEQLSELRKLILGRIGEEFDGECHLTEAEALQAADALESAQAEIARLTTVSGLDEDGLMMVMLNELHSNMPEIDRPMSLSDLSDEQTERARKAVRAVTQAAATIAKGRIERLEAALAKCADKFDFYEQLHRLKCTAEGDEKADRNRELADMCRAALKASPNVG
jgi:hypothetical protein